MLQVLPLYHAYCSSPFLSLLNQFWTMRSLPASILWRAKASRLANGSRRIAASWADGEAIRSHYSYADGPGSYGSDDEIDRLADLKQNYWNKRDFSHRGFTVGIGGPVGSGKTALTLQLCRYFSQHTNIGVVTNDIFTQEDAEFLVRQQALPSDRIRAVETGGCPHAAIREDVSANLSALEELTKSITIGSESSPPLLICESGGDNLAANFSRELADLTLYVIDVAGGDKVPRKGGPGITQSDLLIINKIDLATAVGADLDVMEMDALKMRGGTGPTIMASVKNNVRVQEICDFIQHHWNQALSCSGDGS